MKIFLSYKFTGEDQESLKENLSKISSSLEKAGHKCFYSFFRENFFREKNFTNKQILEYALKELDISDVILAFIKSEDRSEGMLLEIGYAIAKKKKFILAIKKGVKTTFLREMANRRIEFENIEDLCSKLSKL